MRSIAKLSGIFTIAFAVTLFFSNCASESTEPASTEPGLFHKTQEDSIVNLLLKLPDESIQLYAISNERQPPALVLFRHEKAFVFDWNCDAYSPRHQMTLNENFDGNGNDELCVAMVAGSGTGVLWTDLHLVQFFDTKGDGYIDTEYMEYGLIGEKYRDWFEIPIALKAQQENEIIIDLGGDEYAFVISETYGGEGDLLDIFYGDYVEFSLDDSGDIFIRIGICGNSSIWNRFENYIGSVSAKVNFKDGKFAFSDFSFSQES